MIVHAIHDGGYSSQRNANWFALPAVSTIMLPVQPEFA
jgi:hypothetical protein